MKTLLMIPLLVGLVTDKGFSQHLKLSVISTPEVKKETIHDKYGQTLAESDSEYKLALNGVFLFYKEFLSSQDGDNCSFTPSCSEYAVQAVKAKGPIVGGAMFFDRYTRCNSMNREYYKKDHKKRRLIDPVK